MTRNGTDKADNELPKILIYGYGNPGRQDDALGILLIGKFETWLIENKYSFIDTDQNYQLNIEDAESISKYDLVIFLDASVEEIKSVLIEPVYPDLKTDFSMHSVTPAFVLALSQQVFHRSPETYQMHIRGYKYKFMEPVSKEAERNLETAFKELTSFIINYIDTKRDS